MLIRKGQKHKNSAICWEAKGDHTLRGTAEKIEGLGENKTNAMMGV